jgi:transposase
MPKGYALSEATKDGIWKLRAQGLSEREIARRLGLGQNTARTRLVPNDQDGQS